jgi:hypothetical protein
MLSSCAAGVSVVGIDNGFGAACAVLRMLGSADVGSVPDQGHGERDERDERDDPVSAGGGRRG